MKNHFNPTSLPVHVYSMRALTTFLYSSWTKPVNPEIAQVTMLFPRVQFCWNPKSLVSLLQSCQNNPRTREMNKFPNLTSVIV